MSQRLDTSNGLMNPAGKDIADRTCSEDLQTVQSPAGLLSAISKKRAFNIRKSSVRRLVHLEVNFRRLQSSLFRVT